MWVFHQSAISYPLTMTLTRAALRVEVARPGLATMRGSGQERSYFREGKLAVALSSVLGVLSRPMCSAGRSLRGTLPSCYVGEYALLNMCCTGARFSTQI